MSRKDMEEIEVELHSFLRSVLDGDEWSDLEASRYVSGKVSPGRTE